MRRVVALATVVAALGWVGCGGDDSEQTTTGATPTPNEQRVIDVITAYYTAIANGDFRGACDHLTGEREAEQMRLANALATGNGPRVTSCPEALKAIYTPPAAKALLANFHGVSGVKVTGDRAKAFARTATQSGRPTLVSYWLARSGDGGWKFATGANSIARVAPR
jgi:hypothetical protein